MSINIATLCRARLVMVWGDHLQAGKHSQYVASHLGLDWIGLCSVLRPRQHSIGYMGDGFYRSKDPTNSIKVLKEDLQKTKQTTKTTKYTYAET